MTANLDQLNRATAAGLSIENAAPLTWTGLRACEQGYDKVSVIHALPKRRKAITTVCASISVGKKWPLVAFGGESNEPTS